MARLPETVEGLKAVANHETRVQRVYERVYKLKSEMGIPYNKMAEQAGLSRGKMEN